jgi:hypothetical protein
MINVENPLTWQLLQIHTKVLIKALKLLGVIFCNSWTSMPSQSLKTSRIENLSNHSLVSNIQQSRMHGFQKKGSGGMHTTSVETA